MATTDGRPRSGQDDAAANAANTVSLGTAIADRQSLIRAAVDALRIDPGQVTELRAIGVPLFRGRRGVVSGFFDDPDKLVKAASDVEDRGAKGIYVTLNPVDQALLCWADNKLIDGPEHTAADSHIKRRYWLPLDFDPVRPADTSATDDELASARGRALDAVNWLRSQLHDDPVLWGFSGNGYHLLFRIDLPNNDLALRFVSNVLNKTADRFDDERVKVDRTVHNAARIWKLYGTIARKGASIARIGRIHRRSRLMPEGFR